MDDLHRRLVENVRFLAEEKGVGLNQVVEKAGVSRGHFFAVLAGKKSPTLQWMGKVAGALGVDVEEMLLMEPPVSR